MAKARAALGSKRRPDLTGELFGRLKVTSIGPMKGPRQTWQCLCECGVVCFKTTTGLKADGTLSCGCLLKGPTSANAVHGHSPRNERPSRTYNSWRGMMDRCSNASHISYENYGGRGIRVCESWQVFENFLRDMGERPIGRTIDRKRVNENYSKDNCRWATNYEQRHNRTDSPQNMRTA